VFAAPPWQVVEVADLSFTPSVDENSSTDLFRINNDGWIAFPNVVNGERHAMLWIPFSLDGFAAGVYDLTALSGSSSPGIARDLNDARQIVGQSGGLDVGAGQASVWTFNADSTVSHQTLPAQASANWARGLSITNSDPAVVAFESNRLDLCISVCPTGSQADFVGGYFMPLGGAATAIDHTTCRPSPRAMHIAGSSGSVVLAGSEWEFQIEPSCFTSARDCEGYRNSLRWTNAAPTLHPSAGWGWTIRVT